MSRGLIAGLAWWLLPFWLFFLVANGLYWASWFQVKAFIVPLFAVLFLGAISPPSLWAALCIGIIFFLMLGAKELTFIHRTLIYEFLGIALLFSGVLQITMRTEGMDQIYVPFVYFVFGVIFFAFRESASRYKQMQGEGGVEERRRSFLKSAVAGLVLWEYGSVLSGLPLEQIPKSAALFAGAVALFFLSAPAAEGGGRHIRAYAGVALGVLVSVLLATEWTS
ncbi:MAG: hypothetical protein HYY10_00160 [Candidatus Liptonbacteria bacterium]|nr:hypothetical protein [Candidatus Liptonbacteria bacterium]